jgi:hypothetical protein
VETKAELKRLRSSSAIQGSGKLNDNVHIESFYHSMKSDVVHGVRFDHDHEITAERTITCPSTTPATAFIAGIRAAGDV